MDFHSLSRRELQAFCKKNKIPANMTNAAMADALKAIEIVEGIEEFMQQSQSESAQSSIELLDGSEVTSPYVPPTAGRSTRRRNVLKDDAEAVTSMMTTTRRTTRKTAAKGSNESQVDAMQTPAVAAHASRRKVQMASACLKMDSQLKECVEEEKKDALMTPAAVGVASRRRRVEETEKKVYSTRRSVRLAVKNVQMSSGVKSEESELSNNELFGKDCEDQEVNQKEGLEAYKELSGITGVDAIENMEEDKEKSEVVSAEKEDITMGETELVSTGEEETSIDSAVEVQPIENMEEDKEKSEVVSAAKEDITMGETDLGSTREEETSIDSAVEVQLKEEICDNTEYPGDQDAVVPVNVIDEVQQSEGSADVQTCEIEATVENSKEVDIEIDADEAGDFESKVDAVVSEEEVEVECEDDKEVGAEDDQDLNETCNTGSVDVQTCEIEATVENSKEVDAEPQDEAGDFESKVDAVVSDDKEVGCEDDQDLNVALGKLTELRLEQEADAVDLGIPEELKKSETETSEVEESVKNSPSKQPPASLEMGNKALMTGVSDNKENVGAKLPVKNSGESVCSLEAESLRKLTKMLKEKLNISSKSSKQGSEVLPRSALKVLPENKMIDGKGN